MNVSAAGLDRSAAVNERCSSTRANSSSFFRSSRLSYSVAASHALILLLAASCYFYMVFRPVYILILAFTILIDYVAGILIEDSPQPRRKAYLTASLIANVGVLAFFKYFNFLNGNLRALTDWWGVADPIPFLNILLPIGLSFHTFQSLSYTIEVYRGNYRAERHPGIFALYVMFYPQLVAGPIERPQNLLHEFHKEHFFDHQRVVEGLQLMLLGLLSEGVHRGPPGAVS